MLALLIGASSAFAQNGPRLYLNAAAVVLKNDASTRGKSDLEILKMATPKVAKRLQAKGVSFEKANFLPVKINRSQKFIAVQVNYLTPKSARFADPRYLRAEFKISFGFHQLIAAGQNLRFSELGFSQGELRLQAEPRFSKKNRQFLKKMLQKHKKQHGFSELDLENIKLTALVDIRSRNSPTNTMQVRLARGDQLEGIVGKDLLQPTKVCP